MSKPSVVISGSHIRVYINNKIYNEAQQVSYSIDRGEREIYGIDSPFPQEIHSTRYSVNGSIAGLFTKLSGGLQAFLATPVVFDTMKSLYVSIRIQDRQTGEDILLVPDAKISQQNFQVSARGVVTFSFNFRGIIAYEPLDRIPRR